MSTLDPEASVEEQYAELCAGLNMDKITSDEAWKTYTTIRQNYTLEGNQLHWLACALYVACRKTTVPTVGRQQTVEGNCVSLTRLLRSCRLSLIQFFNKARKWADMSNLKKEMREKIDKLERNFAVSNVIFKKYQPIFVDLFNDPSKDPPKVPRSRKQKKPPSTPGDVFDFCWTLFIRIKADFPSISDDLVNSYHLLLSCIDHVHGNAVMASRDDLLNPTFDSGVVDVNTPPCILDKLCAMHDGIINEVKSIREHWWKPYIKKLFDKKMLKGDPDTLSGLLEQANFEFNAKSIRKDYEAYVLSIGEYDERVFLGEEATEEIGTPTKIVPANQTNELCEKIGVARKNLSTQFDGTALIPCTPLSGRHYLRAREQALVTPVSTATYLVSRLNKMVAGKKPEPSPNLAAIMASCNPNPAESVAERIKSMGEKFTLRYTAPSDNHPGSHASFAAMRLRMGQVLYYRVLENILLGEAKRGKPISSLMENCQFHQALFTACLEVVIFSYNSQRTFPWILETFSLEPLQFYKVIEVMIRAEDGLARDVVKHLQRIEEQILESRAWHSSSSVWEAISTSEHGVPSCEDVSLPAGEALVPGASPLSHHKSFSVNIKSPIAGDRFKSPIVTQVARRQLFSAGQSLLAPQSPLAGQSVLTRPPSSPGRSVLSPQKTVNLPQSPGGGSSANKGSAQKPKRALGSLSLFFRKVYHLAHLRLDTLCQSLQVTDEEVKRRIWTCLEWGLRTHTDLMKDRHLDQIIMCSLYIICKVSGKAFDKNFTDIMKHYRNQPQASSHVYRSVLLRPRSGPSAPEQSAHAPQDFSNPPQPHPTPGKLAGMSTISDGEERGDLIKFYNTVFMEKIQEFALKFSAKKRVGELPPLSPLPQLRANPASPCRQVSQAHSLFIRPLNRGPLNLGSQSHKSPHKPLSYSFSRSPAKDLAAINEMMRGESSRRQEGGLGKRRLQLVDHEEVQPKKVLISTGGISDIQAQPQKTQKMVELILGERTKTE